MGWGQMWERIFGYERVGRWRLYRVDASDRRRAALPETIPVPDRVARSWGRARPDTRLAYTEIAAYAGEFIDRHPTHRLTESLRRFVNKAPHAQRLETLLREQQWSDAETELDALLAVDRCDSRASFLRAVARLRRGDLAGADEDLGRAAAGMEDDPEYHVAVGRLREAREDAAAAAASYHRALELAPGHAEALECLARVGEMVEIYLGTLEEPERAFVPTTVHEKMIEDGWAQEGARPEFLVERSHFHLRSGQPRLALKAAERALAGLQDRSAHEPPPPGLTSEALAARCRAFLALERFTEAQSVLDELQAAAPGSVWTVSCRAHLLWFGGERTQALRHLERAIQLDPNRIEDLRLYLNPQGRPRGWRPLEALTELMKTYRQSHAILAIAASVHMVQEDWDTAVRLATEAARLGACDELLVELTGRMGQQGLHKEVCALAETAGGWRRFLRGNPLLRSNVAASFERCGRNEEARELLTSLAEDRAVHPELRLRARGALRPVK